MELIALVTVIAFGLIIGSFLNVVILRIGTGRTFGGRSACASCSTRLHWFELVPVISYLGLRGRCRTCLAKISPQYPVVEAVTAFLFAAAVIVHGVSIATPVELVMLASLVVIATYDVRHKVIPTGPLLWFLGSALLFGLLHGGTLDARLIAGMTLFFPFYALWRVSRGQWMGLGDADLSIGIGFAAGLSLGVSALMLAVWLGAIVGIALVLISKSKNRLSGTPARDTMKSEIPFAPFLIAGFLIALYFGVDVVAFLSL